MLSQEKVATEGDLVQEVLKKEIFTVADIGILFHMKRNVAYRIMKQIKDYSDRWKLSGRVHKQDYLDYINRPQNLE